VYAIARDKETEPAFVGKYADFEGIGTYYCAVCGNKLFRSDAKFASTCGWPSYFEPIREGAVVLAQIFVASPLYVRSARVGFTQIDKQLEEAAHVEGANHWQLFYEVMLPLTGRILLSGAILTWTRALGEFGATILFAGNLEGVTQTMPMAIYLGFERNLGVALSLSVLLIFVSTLLLLLTKKLEKQEQD